jgi:hypothetical protein
MGYLGIFIKLLVFVKETQCVVFEIEVELLRII